MYFAQDPQVSSRILAVLHVGATKSAVPLYEKKQGTKDIFVYNKKTKKGVRDARAGVEVSEAQKFCRTRVGRKLTNEEFLKLYPQQCNAFKEIFKTEYNNLIKK